ncbi:MAG: glycosyl hydrolase family 28-related protein [Bryobacteraceae bacterium]
MIGILLLGAGLFFGSAVTANAQIPLATGSGVTVLPEPQGPFFDVTAYGAAPGGAALTNQAAINNAIAAAAAAGGGTVLIPAGTFKTYSIHLQSNVGLHFESNHSIIQAAIQGTGPGQDGGYYDAPEVNLYVGLQDEGHSHWQNSLIWGIGLQNVMISGPGLIDGSYIDASGNTVQVLVTTDVSEVTTRTSAGTAGQANKAIALENCTNVVFRDFAIKNGGHFGILGTGVNNWTIDGIIIDTDRDALDIDNSQNVTVRNSVFNSIQDDALVLKASFALGTFTPTRNVLLENDIVSGYEAGSVLSGAYAQGQLTPMTGRVKLGTEATGGFDTITIRNIVFDRCAGFAIESVDGAVLKNIVFTDSTMNDVYTPIFIRLGDRGRTPVTGIGTSQTVSPANNVRLDNTLYVLPNLPAQYGYFPASRYSPSYTQNLSVPIGGETNIGSVVSQTAPTNLNSYQTCAGCATNPADADAIGTGAQANGSFADVGNISISNLIVTDADPRYPIILAGLEGHPIHDVNLSNVSVQYRGGLTLQQAAENRALSSTWRYYAYTGNGTTLSSGSISWFGGSSNEGNLPRIGWDPAANGGAGGWAQDPYNIPELPFLYPENVMFGPLPAYGIWARHVTGLTVSNVSLSFLAEDTRPAVVLDDVGNSVFENFTADAASGVPVFVEVTNTKKRPAELEYVQYQPYSTDTVASVTLPPGLAVQLATVNRPAPGTPADNLYAYPTVPSAAHPYSYSVANASYPLPVTVYRPFFGTATPSRFYRATVGQQLQFTVQAYSPASGSETAAAQTGLIYSTGALPSGTNFDSQVFTWTPTQVGVHQVQFIVSDGVIPESKTVTISVGNPNLPVANPGQSRIARLGSLVTLDGSGSQDAAGTAPQLPAWWTLSFAWTQTEGPAVALGSGGATAMMPTFVPTVAGSYTFQLVVNDGPAFSAPASVTIMVPILRQRKRGVRSFSSSGK